MRFSVLLCVCIPVTYFMYLTSGLESGSVTLKEPASVEEIDDAEQIILHCQIDGHPR